MTGLGTNEIAVYQALSNVNGAGLKLIFNVFGIRGGENLYEWFLDDLNDFELEKVRTIWVSAGLIPPF